ncbi:hypothetical protein CEUSTIGMA_g6099.t1 [Chlamydomonas eustigma]|uniref:Prolyl 4-hydroxylase alpha subunit Fe(2+) 2OG dioxygenase domain-containing protein n=1 Tax=Chlamydomonas eustigma TaxID=1157962 RepID=A0A250X6F1_9CHLO|nr:hypothetical protein CEUSTIGMA_g6099.t1 [Chlamydomonas eustigma]|eukprot:GAX78661.1 hypothetical protein CEUSTIGMA_g6099.t1 [Chlamydomonas eustigma]
MGGDNARRRRRREVEFSMQEIQRREMNNQEIQALLRAVRKGSKAEFGLVKLSSLDLNALICQQDDAPLLDWTPHTTLLEYACWLQQDAVCGALLKAGADPTIRYISCNHLCDDLNPGCTEQPTAIFQEPSTSTCSIWIVKNIVQMRAAAAAITAAQSKLHDPTCVDPVQQPSLASEMGACSMPTLQQQCRTCTAKDEGYKYCSSSTPHCSICHADPPRCPLRDPFCGHMCCEACVWRRLCACGDGHIGAGSCCPCLRGSDSVTPAEASNTLEMWNGYSKEEAHHMKKESRLRWEKLPSTCPSNKEVKGCELEKPRFRALPGAEVAKLYLGGTRAQRQSNLWKAATCGKVDRIRALVEAGALVDGVNEYGQTPVYLAVLHGHEEAVQLLCSWAGADVELRANGGSSCCTVAAAAGRVCILHVLSTCGGADLGAPGAEGKTAWQYAHEMGHQEVIQYLLEKDQTTQALEAMCWTMLFQKPCYGALGLCSTGFQQVTSSIPLKAAHDSGAYKGVERFYLCDAEGMAPHVDLSKKNPGDLLQRSSSKTFLLYLDACGEGGETLLLEREGPSIEASGEILASVTPASGRFLLFPHKCPHAGAPVDSKYPKLVLRGELY